LSPAAGNETDSRHSDATLVLWQGPAQGVPANGNVLLWQGVAQQPGSRSLTEYLEEHGVEVRRRYLAWSYEFGETRVMGRALRQRLRVFRAGSLWPVSMFVEQSTWKQASLEKILKVLALDLLLESEQPKSLRFAGADRNLGRVLEGLCRDRQIRYSSVRLPARRAGVRSGLRHWLPHTLQGLAAPVYFLIRRWRLRRPRPAPSGQAARRMLICAPFINHTAEVLGARDFASKYWSELPQLVLREGYELLWLHIFYPHERIPTAAVAAQVVARIEADSGSSGAHEFVDAYFSMRGLLRVLAQWAGVALESIVVGACLRARFACRPRESFWPLLRSDWARAFRGIECAAALFYLECFDQALAAVPHQDEGIYLMENQGWERALIRAWRRHGHGRLTAVAHSTLRFWDLRYHCDERRYQPEQRGHIPEPDVVAVNGAQARRAYLATCANRERVVECEGLRYLQLAPGEPSASRARKAEEPLRLLVLGDFLPQSTAPLLQLAADAVRESRQTAQIWVKPHPNCPVAAEWLPGVQFKIVDEAVASLAPSVDLVLASNTTSAALDAYLSQARVLVYDDRSGVNFSPLRSVPGVRFVHHVLELREALAEARDARQAFEPSAAEFFHTDRALPRWRAYLGIGPHRPRRSAAASGQDAYNEDCTT
jgi:surface carbohydrate biosynthesis protein (TIGR04326 family)